MSASAQSASPLRRVLAFFAPPPPPVKPIAAKPIAAKHVAAARIGRGCVDPGHRAGVRRIVVTVDEDLFERLRARAVGRRVPMAAAVRHLLERGLAKDAP